MTSEFFDWRRNTEFWWEKEHLDYKCKEYIDKIHNRFPSRRLEGRIGQILDLSKFSSKYKSSREYQDNKTEFLTSNKYKSSQVQPERGMELRLSLLKANFAWISPRSSEYRAENQPNQVHNRM